MTVNTYERAYFECRCDQMFLASFPSKFRKTDQLARATQRQAQRKGQNYGFCDGRCHAPSTMG